MQTSTSKLLARLICEEKTVNVRRFFQAEDWIKIILTVIRRIKRDFCDYDLFVKLSEPIPNGFVQYCARSWDNSEPPYDRESRGNALKSCTLPPGITLETRVTRVFNYYSSSPEGHNWEILLTDQGVLLFCDYEVSGRVWDEKTHSSRIEFFTTTRMKEDFRRKPFMAYTIFYNLCHLPEVHMEHVGYMMERAKETWDFTRPRCALVEEVE